MHQGQTHLSPCSLSLVHSFISSSFVLCQCFPVLAHTLLPGLFNLHNNCHRLARQTGRPDRTAIAFSKVLVAIVASFTWMVQWKLNCFMDLGLEAEGFELAFGRKIFLTILMLDLPQAGQGWDVIVLVK